MLLLEQIIAKHKSVRHQMYITAQRRLELVHNKAINYNYTS